MVEMAGRKVTLDAIRGAAAEGLSGSEIADRLGVSRQRVSQLIVKNGINVRPAIRRPIRRKLSDEERQGARGAAPRILTGGVYLTSNKHAAGTVSELLVAADLVARGWSVYVPIFRNRGHDLIAYKDQEFLTIEVRSGKRIEGGKIVYSQPVRKDKSSHFAVVVTGEPVHYDPEIPDAPAG